MSPSGPMYESEIVFDAVILVSWVLGVVIFWAVIFVAVVYFYEKYQSRRQQ